MTSKIRVRYAPSPTGHLHIGNARTAIFNYLYARHEGGDFIIRIEDTDTKRNVEGGEESQLENLEWLGVDWDESPEKPGGTGPYRQSERTDIYAEYAQQLLESGHAYYSFDTPEELEEERETQRAKGLMPKYSGKWRDASEEEIAAAREEGRPEAIRFRIPDEGVYSFDDMVKGKVEFQADSVGGDFVIVKSDGMPTYNFGVVVDDHLMEITHVLRGDDHVANTPKQMMIYEALGWQPPIFGHMTLIINGETGKKLSKRDTDILQFIEQYRDLGYHPQGLFNYIALLGWSPVGEEELYTPEELIEIFDADRLSTSPASFDQHKLDWMSSQYIGKMDTKQLTEWALPHLIQARLVDEDADQNELDYVEKVVGLYQKELDYAAQIIDLASIFFHDTPEYSESAKEALAFEGAGEVIESFKNQLNDLDETDYQADKVQPLVKAVQKETGIKGKNLFMPLRAALLGEASGPGVNETVEVLGKEKTHSHLDYALQHISK